MHASDELVVIHSEECVCGIDKFWVVDDFYGVIFLVPEE